MTSDAPPSPDLHPPAHHIKSDFNEIEIVIAKTMEYLSVPSVVGHETIFLDYLQKDMTALGLHACRYPGLLEVHGNDEHSAVICAHIDRHGLISLGKGEYAYAAQYIKEIKYGEANRSSRKEIESLGKRFAGEMVLAYDPKTGQHLGEGVIEVCHPMVLMGEALFYVQGMKAAKQNVPVAYARTAREQDGYIKGQIDNAMSIGVIYSLFRDGFQGTVLFSTEEEIGKSWIHITDFLKKTRVKTQNLLVIDTSPYADSAPIDEGLVILRNRDKSAWFNPEMTYLLKLRCDQLGIPYQFKDEVLLAKGKTVDQLGSTELGKIILNTKKEWTGASVQIPTMMYHTSNETTSRKAIRNYYHLLKNILIEDPLPLRSKVK